MTVKSLLTAIADAIRAKTASNATYSLSQIRDFLNMGQKTDHIKDLIERTIESYTIPSSVTSIGSHAFHGTALTSVTIPSSVTSIGDGAFMGCSKLTSITIPNSVTSIGSSAFWGCSKLTSITIPNSVTSIRNGVFSACSKLTDIYCGFAEGAVSGAPWGATNATIHYNSNGPAN